MRANEPRDNPHMNFGYFPPFGGNPPDFSGQPMPSYMFPYQNYMGQSMGNNSGSIFEDNNKRGGMVDNLIIQNQSEQNVSNESVNFKME